MRMKIYDALVNKHSGIAQRYHRIHDGSGAAVKLISWAYLLWLNFAFYVLGCRFLGRAPQMEIYEKKRLNCERGEAEAYITGNPGLSVDAFVEKLSSYNVISFDIFDTMIFRPFSLPEDVFYLMGDELGIMDFKNIRIQAERDARTGRYVREGDGEIGIREIWDELEKETGISSEQGQALEMAVEEKLCFANLFMLAVWRRLQALGKTLIAVSDMYLPETCIVRILEQAGFSGAKKIYISNEYHKSKADGKLYGEVLRDHGCSMIHIGDNPHSDVRMARHSGLEVLPYPNVNKNALLYRAFDMSPLVGSAYRGIVNSKLYAGLETYSMEYEYGFVYGGLFVLGYCVFIHDYCDANRIERVLFLSRDGDILKQVYDILYPEADVTYAYWSRKAAAKLEAAFDRHDYFRRFIYHKMNQGYSVGKILHAMELDFLGAGLTGALRPEDELTDKNAPLLRRFVEERWERVEDAYRGQNSAAKAYYAELLAGVSRAAAVDIGWAGSGAMTLKYLAEREWKLPCEIIGLIAGTNTVHNAEPDAAEPFLQSGKLVPYLYSQKHNRDLLKKHDPGKGYNVFWELLLSSPTPQFQGFYEGRKTEGQENECQYQYMEGLNITLRFGGCDANPEGIRKIQRGILDFAREYYGHFRDFPYMLRIGGRDAYAPMLVAASDGERYLRAIERKFEIQINVD